VIHEDVPHGPGGDGEEVPAALPHPFRPAGEAQVGLVHEGRRLERARGRLTAHRVLGQPVKLGVEIADQLVPGSEVLTGWVPDPALALSPHE
jgi:hypothetical protein